MSEYIHICDQFKALVLYVIRVQNEHNQWLFVHSTQFIAIWKVSRNISVFEVKLKIDPLAFCVSYLFVTHVVVSADRSFECNDTTTIPSPLF